MSYCQRIKNVLNRAMRVKDLKDGSKGFTFLDERTLETVHESAWLIPAGYSIVNVRRQKRNLSASCGAEVEIEDRGGVVVVRVIVKELPSVIKLTTDLLEKGKIILGLDTMQKKTYLTWQHPHMIIGAETGWGKTEIIRAIIYQECLWNPPDSLEIHIVDMKGGVSFLPFSSVRHITEISYDLDTSYSLIKQAYYEMHQRADEVRLAGSRRFFKNYKRIILVIDEAAELSPAMIRDPDMRKVAREIDMMLSSLARLGREIGFHLIYCTQYPHSNVVNPQVKVNCGARICFHVPQQVQSCVVLDEAGAEDLNVKGRAIVKLEGKSKIIQALFLPPDHGETNNDTAWEKLLMPMKTEVLHHGNSQRKNPSRTIYDSNGDHGTTLNYVRQLESVQARIGNTVYAGKGKAGDRREDGRHAKALDAHEEGEIYVEGDVPTGEQPSSYIGDW